MQVKFVEWHAHWQVGLRVQEQGRGKAWILGNKWKLCPWELTASTLGYRHAAADTGLEGREGVWVWGGSYSLPAPPPLQTSNRFVVWGRRGVVIPSLSPHKKWKLVWCSCLPSPSPNLKKAKNDKHDFFFCKKGFLKKKKQLKIRKNQERRRMTRDRNNEKCPKRFFPSPAPIFGLYLSLGVFSWNFGGV